MAGPGRAFAGALALAALLAWPPSAAAQDGRARAIAALRGAAQAGDAHAQFALASLLETGDGTDDEARRWYERAARAGDRVAQRRLLAMGARGGPGAASPPPAFMIRLPRGQTLDDIPEPPADLPPGYHCHYLGGGRMWCHGGVD